MTSSPIRPDIAGKGARYPGRGLELLFVLVLIAVVALLTSWAAVRRGETWLLE